MTHFGVISPPVPGHLNPMCALAIELKNRGHRVTFFQMADVEKTVSRHGVDFRPLGHTDHPPDISSCIVQDMIGKNQG